MRINGIIQAFKAQVLQKRVRPGGTDQAARPITDQVRISKEARALQKSDSELNVARTALQQVPNVRADRVADARKALQSGRYNTPEVTSRISERLLEGGIAGRLTGNTKVTPLAARIRENTSPLGENRLNQLRDRISSNFYARREVTQNLAQRLLRNFQI